MYKIDDKEKIDVEILNAISDPIGVLDNDYTVILYNKAVFQMLGKQPHEAIGKKCYQLVGRDKPCEICAVRKSYKSGEIEQVIRYDKELGIWIDLRAYPILDNNNRVVRVIEHFRDITNIKQTELMLRERTEELKTVLDAIPAFVFIGLDTECKNITGNRYVNELFGITPETNVSQTAVEKKQKAFPIKHLKADGTEYGADELPMQKSIALAQEIRGQEFSYLFSDERQVYVFGNAAPLFDDKGQVRGSVGAFWDITERKMIEQEKEELQKQLLQSQKMESVGRLAGGIAHDFNNMLGVILGYAELSLSTLDTEHPVYNNLQEIRKAAERSANLTKQLLAFARKQTIKPEVLDLNQVISGIYNMLRRIIGEDIELEWLPSETPAFVEVDPSQIDQVLANLCVNSRDAVKDKNKGKITIETGRTIFEKEYCASHLGFVEGEFVLLAISDNGCGMDKETLSKLFEPFFTTKETGKGTGLGLATVYGIIKQNNGFINVYSEKGIGTTFKIYLPKYNHKTQQVSINNLDKIHIKGHEIILLVEDEPVLLEMTRNMLELNGYNVLTAETAGEALNKIREYLGEIHLIITDVVMPEMNGRELANQVLNFYPQIKRLFMSGYTANVIAHHGVLEKGVNFLQKPFTINELISKVRYALDN